MMEMMIRMVEYQGADIEVFPESGHGALGFLSALPSMNCPTKRGAEQAARKIPGNLIAWFSLDVRAS
jgi:hypothetical protein